MMKKALILAVAVLAVAAQSHAGPDDVKHEGRDKESVHEATHDGQEAASVHTPTGIAKTGSHAQTAANLDPDASTRLSHAIAADESLQKVVDSAIAHMGSNAALAKAQIKGISNFGLIGNDSSAEAQEYKVLVLKVATAARSWTGSSKDISTLLLEKTNDKLANGSNVRDALTRSAAEIEQQAGKKIKLDDILTSCANV